MLEDQRMTNKVDATEHTSLPVEGIRTDGGTQVRVRLNQEAVKDYAGRMKDADTFPPVVVFFDGTDYWLGDGFHRLAAAKKLGLPAIAAEVRTGSKRDALLFAVRANHTHGVQRTRADKQQAVKTLLKDPEWRLWSDRQIGCKCGVDGKTVARLRKELTAEIPQIRYAVKNGRVYSLCTSRIGEARKQEDVAEAEAARSTSPADESEPVVAPEEASWGDTPERLRGAFQTIVVAPPWPLTPQDESTALAAIRALPVADLSASDAVLWLWAPTYHLTDALEIIQAWGFYYDDLVAWLYSCRWSEDRMSGKHECCVVAMRGRPSYPLSHNALWQEGVFETHDRTLFYEFVEKESPGSKVELFALAAREGWTMLGDGKGGFAWQEVAPDLTAPSGTPAEDRPTGA
jgi:N6-adenosine-specific RNA methylase IME4